MQTQVVPVPTQDAGGTSDSDSSIGDCGDWADLGSISGKEIEEAEKKRAGQKERTAAKCYENTFELRERRMSPPLDKY